MTDRPPGQAGFTAKQRAAIRAVEEEAVLDVVTDMLRRLDSMGNRLERFVQSDDYRQNQRGRPGEST